MNAHNPPAFSSEQIAYLSSIGITLPRFNTNLIDVKTAEQEILEYLNFKAGRSFDTTHGDHVKLVRKRLCETKRDIPGIKKMIDRMCEKWMGTEFEEYLRPSTIFNGKFHEHYADRHRAVTVSKMAMDAKRKQIETAVNFHPCNRNNPRYKTNPTKQEQDDYQSLRTKLQQLDQQLATI